MLQLESAIRSSWECTTGGRSHIGRRLRQVLTAVHVSLVQTEKAFQKQLGVNGGWKKPARKTPGKGGQRYYKNVGLGFKTPKEAIEGEMFEWYPR